MLQRVQFTACQRVRVEVKVEVKVKVRVRARVSRVCECVSV